MAPVDTTSADEALVHDDLNLKEVLAIFLRTWPYIKPSSRHLINFVLLSGVAFLLGAGMGLILIALAVTGIMTAEPLGEFYVNLYGLDPERFLNVEVLSAAAQGSRLAYRTNGSLWHYRNHSCICFAQVLQRVDLPSDQPAHARAGTPLAAGRFRRDRSGRGSRRPRP